MLQNLINLALPMTVMASHGTRTILPMSLLHSTMNPVFYRPHVSGCGEPLFHSFIFGQRSQFRSALVHGPLFPLLSHRSTISWTGHTCNHSTWFVKLTISVCQHFTVEQKPLTTAMNSADIMLLQQSAAYPNHGWWHHVNLPIKQTWLNTIENKRISQSKAPTHSEFW